MSAQLQPPPSFLFDPISRLREESSLERQELAAFQWLSKLAADIEAVPAQLLKSNQQSLERSLALFLSPAVVPVKPSRALRRLISGAYLSILSRADSRRAFDLIVASHANLSATHKVTKDNELVFACIRMMNVQLLGRLSERFGSNYYSVLGESVHLLLKILKSSPDTPLRLETLDALSRTIRGAGRGFNDTNIKDTLKYVRLGLTDKSMPVRGLSAQCIAGLARQCPLGLQTVPDFESFLHPLFRALDGSDYSARISIAGAVANVLATSQTITAFPISPNKPPKKSDAKKQSGAGQDADEAPTAQMTEERSLLTCPEMLSLLPLPLLKLHGRDSRVGVVESYVFLFQLLGVSFVETHHIDILDHVANEVLSSPRFVTLPLPEAVSIKELMVCLLRYVGTNLPETAQLNAIVHILDRFGAKWPASAGSHACSKWVLSTMLSEVAGLLNNVDNVAGTLPDSVTATVLKLCGHPSHLVQVAGSLCVQRLGLNSPSTFATMFQYLHGSLFKNMTTLTSASNDNIRKYIGHSLALSVLLSIVSKIPLYVPTGAVAHVFTFAANLLRSRPKDDKVATATAEVGWNLLSGLMVVGSNVVKSQLSQLLLLLKEGLPKLVGGSQVGLPEFLHSRSAALRAMYALLISNADILNPDLQKRLAVLVINVVQFVVSHPTLASHGLSPVPSSTKVLPLTLTFGELECLFRKRLFNCITLLPIAQFDSFIPQLIKAAGDLFAQDPADTRRFDPGQQYQVYHAFEKQLVPVNSPFGPLFWQSAEYGAHTIRTFGIPESVGRHSPVHDPGYVCRIDNLFDYEKWETLEQHIFHPITGAPECDSITLLNPSSTRPQPSPPSFALINSAIAMFGMIFPYIPTTSQEAFLETYARFIKQKQDRPGKRVALLVNVIQSFHVATTMMMQLNLGSSTKTYALTSQATKSLLEIAQVGNCSADGGVRLVSADLIGRVADLAVGNSATGSISQFLVSQIVDNRDPDVRAGAAMALVMIHAHAGASSTIKTTVGVLHTLCADLHPNVASWATLALSHLLESRGSQLYSLITPTLSVVCRQLMLETRPQFVGRVLFGCIDSFGPDLQESHKIRELLVQFTRYLLEFEGLDECAEAWRAATHLLLMAPGSFVASQYTNVLQALLVSDHTTLRRSVLHCLCSMIQREPQLVLSHASDLERSLVLLSHTESDLVHKSIASLLETSVCPSQWIDLCRSLLSPSTGGAVGGGKPDASVAVPYSGSETEDDGDEIAVTSFKSSSEHKKTYVRWHNQHTALQSLRELIKFLVKGTHKEYHLDLAKARTTNGDWVVSRLGELIRVAFTASTALSHFVRREGLGLLEDLLEYFNQTEDPDFPGHRLLEQYQAQFSSALNPAFTSDANPDLVATASHVCARYISSGITDDLLTLSRMIRLLSQALEMVQRSPSTGVSAGAGHPLSQHAQIMISLAVLGAWADIKQAAGSSPSLLEVVEPHLPALLSLWLSCLVEFSIVKQEQETVGALPSNLETISSNLSYALSCREVVLPLYNQCWVSILSAFTQQLQHQEAFSLLSKQGSQTTPKGSFDKLHLVLIGLAFESLVSVRSSEESTNSCLDALNALLLIQGLSDVLPAMSEEILTMANRLMQTESPLVQSGVLTVVKALLTQHQSSLDSESLFHAISLLYRAVTPIMPQFLSDPSAALIFGDIGPEHTALCFDALFVLGDLALRHSKWVPLTLYLYAAALSSEALTGQAKKILVILKEVVDSVSASDDGVIDVVFSLSVTLLQCAEQTLATSAHVSANCLLAATICVTNQQFSGNLLGMKPRLVAVISQAMHVPEVTLVALQCTRSLMQLCKRADQRAFSEQFVCSLLPHLVSMTVTEPCQLGMPAFSECVTTMALAGSLHAPKSEHVQQSPITLVVVSTLIGLVVRYQSGHPWTASVQPVIMHGITAMAKAHTTVFRAVVAQLPPASRSTLEALLRGSPRKDMAGGASGHEKPSIELKMAF